MVTPAMRTTAVLLGFLNLMTSDKFKIIITLRRAQKFGDTGPYKNFIFLNNPLTDKFFWKFELNAMGRICPMSVKGLYLLPSLHVTFSPLICRRLIYYYNSAVYTLYKLHLNTRRLVLSIYSSILYLRIIVYFIIIG